MSRNHGRSSYIKSGSWDESAIDQVYTEQLDRVGDILDRLQISGLGPLLVADDFLRIGFRLLEIIEKELLLQWQLKRDQGLERVLQRQRQWLYHELRRKEGLLAVWNEYCSQALKRLAAPAALLDSHPWRSRILEMMTDPAFYPGGCGGRNTTSRDRILRSCCTVFRELYEFCPYHQVTSFLNLIELGSGYRPEICDPGEAAAWRPDGLHMQERRAVLAELDKPESWDGISDRLIDFWDADGSDGIA